MTSVCSDVHNVVYHKIHHLCCALKILYTARVNCAPHYGSRYTDFLRERGNSLKLYPGDSVLPGEERPVFSLELGEQPWIL